MDPKETAQTLFNAIQASDFEKAKSLLTDDFIFSGPVPEPINGPAWLGLSDYQFKIEGVDGDTVNTSAQLKGTHTGNLDLTAMGMGVIPPTNKAFAATRESGKVTVQGEKIKALFNEPTEGAGLMAILVQLGIQLPAR